MIVHARGQQERMTLVAYIASKIGVSPQALVGSMPFDIAAVKVAGFAKGAVLYTNIRGHSVEISWAGEKGWMTRENIREIFSYAFDGLGCLVAFGSVECKNETSMNVIERLGCKIIGIVPHLFGKDRNGQFCCMTRDECPWTKVDRHVVEISQSNQINREIHG